MSCLAISPEIQQLRNQKYWESHIIAGMASRYEREKNSYYEYSFFHRSINTNYVGGSLSESIRIDLYSMASDEKIRAH